MKMNALLKKYWPDAAAVVLFLLISLAYFITPISQNLVLGGHDNTGGLGLSREQTEYMAQTGERTRWTNSLFCGMPTYQIAPSYDSTEPSACSPASTRWARWAYWPTLFSTCWAFTF